MSNFKSAASRATLTAVLGGLSMAMIGNAQDFEMSSFDDDDVRLAVTAEAEDTVDNLNDDEVDAMNDDDEIDAMDDEEDIEAMTDEEIEEAEEELEEEEDANASVRVAASRIAGKVMADLTAKKSANKAAHKTAKKSRKKSGKISSDKKDDRMATAKQILSLPEAKGREAHARTLAFDTDMTVDEAKAALKADKAKTGSTRLSQIQDPDIGAGGGKSGKTASLDQVLKNHQAANRKRVGQV